MVVMSSESEFRLTTRPMARRSPGRIAAALAWRRGGEAAAQQSSEGARRARWRRGEAAPPLYGPNASGGGGGGRGHLPNAGPHHPLASPLANVKSICAPHSDPPPGRKTRLTPSPQREHTGPVPRRRVTPSPDVAGAHRPGAAGPHHAKLPIAGTGAPGKALQRSMV